MIVRTILARASKLNTLSSSSRGRSIDRARHIHTLKYRENERGTTKTKKQQVASRLIEHSCACITTNTTDKKKDYTPNIDNNTQTPVIINRAMMMSSGDQDVTSSDIKDDSNHTNAATQQQKPGEAVNMDSNAGSSNKVATTTQALQDKERLEQEIEQVRLVSLFAFFCFVPPLNL
jgi:hypothetical protein